MTNNDGLTIETTGNRATENLRWMSTMMGVRDAYVTDKAAGAMEMTAQLLEGAAASTVAVPAMEQMRNSSAKSDREHADRHFAEEEGLFDDVPVKNELPNLGWLRPVHAESSADAAEQEGAASGLTGEQFVREHTPRNPHEEADAYRNAPEQPRSLDELPDRELARELADLSARDASARHAALTLLSMAHEIDGYDRVARLLARAASSHAGAWETLDALHRIADHAGQATLKEILAPALLTPGGAIFTTNANANGESRRKMAALLARISG